MPMRPSLRMLIALAWPTSPRTSAAGTRTSVSRSGHVELARMPSLSSFFPISRPAAPRGTTNAVMPRWPADGSALAKTTKTPASAEFEIHIFSPFRR